ncbi:hypothetical protein BgiMline_007896 [Biomphalaria glabrata]|nr:hypothetical protein BgiMline_018597 [Biomphalaria glabrata]KAI8788569.1 hypothetical protein BgiBS90_011237 [Biomphalaria glabrata]
MNTNSVSMYQLTKFITKETCQYQPEERTLNHLERRPSPSTINKMTSPTSWDTPLLKPYGQLHVFVRSMQKTSCLPITRTLFHATLSPETPTPPPFLPPFTANRCCERKGLGGQYDVIGYVSTLTLGCQHCR